VPPSGKPQLRRRGRPRELPLDVLPPERFVAHVAESDFELSRLSLELLLPDAIRGDRTIVTDVVRVDLPANAESEAASFDGSLRVHFAPGALAHATPLAIASTAGPARFVEGRRSLGRFHALETGDGAPFHGPVQLVLHVPKESGAVDRDRVEVRRFDEKTREFVVVPSVAGPEPDALLATIDGPEVVALFER
jgi:hypothetical protein